jgi:plasmid maintenance system antidote protein VapI
MKTVIDYLNDLKEKLGSDYRTAKLMEVDKTTISNIRRRGLMSDETAIKVADLLGIAREEVLISAAIARSEGEVKTTWEKLGRNIRRAALILLTIGISSYESKAYADIGLNKDLPVIYIMRSL